MSKESQIKKIHAYVPRITMKTLCRLWLSAKKESVKPSTYAKYCFVCSHYLEVYLSHYEKSGLDQKVQQMTVHLLEDGRQAGRPLSPKTVNDILIILNQVLKFGISHGYGIDDCQIRYPKFKKPIISIMSPAEQQCLELYLQADKKPVHLAIMIALCTGLRIGEICGLRWEDFNFFSESITVRRSVSRIQIPQDDGLKTQLVITAPKTVSSQRIIPLPSILCNYIQVLPYEKCGYILTGKENCMEPRQLFAQYKKVLKKCGLERYNFHTLRHTFATRCVENGVNVKALSEILGHANTKTTIDRYVHPTLEMKRREINRVFSSENKN